MIVVHLRDERWNICDLFELPAPHQQSLLERADFVTDLTYMIWHQFNSISPVILNDLIKNEKNHLLRAETGEMYLEDSLPDADDIRRLATILFIILLDAIIIILNFFKKPGKIKI
jgi:hypothetical protein